MSFHTFFLPEDHCVHFLFKNLGRQMPEDVVWKELEALVISVQGVFSSPLGTFTRTLPKAAS
jgi:hypothetical protein